MYARPLLATDLSDGAATAARNARLILAPGHHGLAIVVMEEPRLPLLLPGEVFHDVQETAQRHAKDAEAVLARWLDDHGLDAWSSRVVRDPSVTAALLRAASGSHADVIVVGDRGAGRIERALLGSVARGVLHRAPTDVLIARGEPKLGHILVATDMQPASVAGARRASAIAKAAGARVTLLHAIDPGLWAGALYPTPPGGRFDAKWLDEHVLKELDKFSTEHLGGEVEEVVVHGRAAQATLAYAKENAVDLIVIGAHGGGAASRLLLGSAADAIAERAECSVLVVRHPA